MTEIMFDLCGNFLNKEHKTMQNHLAFGCIDKLLSFQNFDSVIEIGTSFGGLSIMLHEKSKEYGFHFSTYDVVDRCNIQMDDECARIDNKILRDVFHKDSIQEMQSRINYGKCLILCDGGDKIKEFNTFSKLIKPGDFIMAHDYCDTIENFENVIKGKFWNWHEIWDEKIEEGLSHVTKYTDVDFTNAVWLCCVKG